MTVTTRREHRRGDSYDAALPASLTLVPDSTTTQPTCPAGRQGLAAAAPDVQDRHRESLPPF